MRNLTFTLTAAAAVALVAAVALPGDVAEARQRGGRAELKGPRGAATVDRNVTRQRVSRVVNSTATGPGGNTTSVTDTRTRDRQAGTYSHDRERTFSDGTTRSVDKDLQKTGEGTYSGTRTVTGRNGETRTQTGDFTASKTEDGRSVSGTIQTQNNGQVDYQKDVVRGEGSRSVTSSATYEDGTSRSRASSTVRDAEPGVVTTNSVYTNRAGETKTLSNVRTPSEDGATVDRDITYSDGTTRSVDITRTKTGQGTADVSRTVTGRNGDTRTQTGTIVVTPTQPQ